MSEDGQKDVYPPEKDVLGAEEADCSESPILNLKKEVAGLYISKVLEKKSALSFLVGEGDALKDYLISEDALDHLEDKLKGAFFGNLFSSIDPELVRYLHEAKERLDRANTSQELEKIKTELLGTEKPVSKDNAGSNPNSASNNQSLVTSETGLDKSSIESQSDLKSGVGSDPTVISNTSFSEKNHQTNLAHSPTVSQPILKVESPGLQHVSGDFDKLMIGSLGVLAISNIEIDYVRSERKKIEKNIEIAGDFAEIRKIRNSTGKVILECRGETPYIHKSVIKDLIGFSLLFYKKVGRALTLESSYRDIAHQKRLKREKGKLAADAGKSGHNLGVSIDVSSDRYSKKIGGLKGFKELASKFNFNPIASEDWHFDYGILPPVSDRILLAQRLDNQFKELDLAA